ncbi:MAG: hypothetical protein Q4P13_09265 [Psychrobacter sp.]|nr:hypothetical protein [Psychrobacter sp.]
MQDKKLKEMFAVVFTFAVMGIIGFSIFQPDEKVLDNGKSTLANTALTASDEQNASALQSHQPVVVQQIQ